MNTKVQPCETERSSRDAFTLTELLVVIGTLALLALMLLPALADTRPATKIFQCLLNQKRLAQALILSASDHNGALVPYAQAGSFWNPVVNGVTAPWNMAASPGAATQLVRSVLSSTNNPLAPYTDDPTVYHCPADNRAGNPPGYGWAYDSYSKTQNITGDPANNYWGAGATCTNISSIAVPVSTFCFIEPADSRGYNEGSWTVLWFAGATRQSFNWVDPSAMFHGAVGTFAFADGQAEEHHWTDTGLIDAGLQIATGRGSVGRFTAKTSGPDYLYIYERYRFPGWK